MITYKAEIKELTEGPNRGYGNRSFVHEDKVVVDHIVIHWLMDGYKSEEVVRSVITTEVTS